MNDGERELDEDEMNDAYLSQLKRDIAKALERKGVEAYPADNMRDIYVHGWLTDIVAVYLEYRSEIDEELGDGK